VGRFGALRRIGKIRIRIKSYEINFYPAHSQHLAGPPPFLAIPDPKVFPVKPNLDRLNLTMVGDKMTELLEGFYRVKGAEIREDLLQIDFHQHDATTFLNGGNRIELILFIVN
jgi:hypothetical protein